MEIKLTKKAEFLEKKIDQETAKAKQFAGDNKRGNRFKSLMRNLTLLQ